MIIFIIGFEFVQYPLEQFFDKVSQFNLRYKNYKSENLRLNDDTVINNSDDFDFLLEELSVNILVYQMYRFDYLSINSFIIL